MWAEQEGHHISSQTRQIVLHFQQNEEEGELEAVEHHPKHRQILHGL